VNTVEKLLSGLKLTEEESEYIKPIVWLVEKHNEESKLSVVSSTTLSILAIDRTLQRTIKDDSSFIDAKPNDFYPRTRVEE